MSGISTRPTVFIKFGALLGVFLLLLLVFVFVGETSASPVPHMPTPQDTKPLYGLEQTSARTKWNPAIQNFNDWNLILLPFYCCRGCYSVEENRCKCYCRG